MNIFSTLIDKFCKLFHICYFKTIEITHKNRKCEIWIQECRCGKKREVIFGSDDKCKIIKK